MIFIDTDLWFSKPKFFNNPILFVKYHIRKIVRKIREKITGWHDDLIWCPSQCTKKIKYNGCNYELYLRWRHDNPWRGYIIRLSNGLCSKELIVDYNIPDYKLSFAKEVLFAEGLNYLKNKGEFE